MARPEGAGYSVVWASRQHRQVAEEAVKSAVKDYYDKNGIAYDKSKFPTCEDCESCRMV